MPVTLVCQYLPCSQTYTAKRYKADRSRFCSHQCYCHWKTANQIVTFWDKVQICAHGFDCPFCCWPWEGATENVYKNTTLRNKFVPAHRLAWELGNNRQLPKELQAAHWCHRKPCCNFMHIHPATPQENSDDSVRDKRMRSGEQHTNSKLTEEAALEAFRLKMLGWGNTNIAHYLYGEMGIKVSTSTIDKLMSGRMWKHLPRPPGMPHFPPGYRKPPLQSPEQAVLFTAT